MNRKIMLLVLGAVSAMMLAVPAMASALISLHLNPTPSGAQVLHDVGTDPTWSTTGGATTKCNSVIGSATFEAGGTTGSMQLTFGPNCIGPFGFACTSHIPAEPAGNLMTTVLPFHLVTLPNGGRGVLVTPSADGAFTHYTCAGINNTITGNGLIGTITNRVCNEIANEATIDFNAVGHGVQEHTTVAGTDTIYRAKRNEENAALDATLTITFKDAPGNPLNTQLICT